MKRPRKTLRRFSLALAVICCLVLLITTPFFIDGRHNDLALRGAAVFAASRDSYSLSSPIRLLEAPVIELASGTLSMPPNRTGLARSGEVLAMLITGKTAQMTLENATFTADFSTSVATFSQGSLAGGVAPLVTTFQMLQFDNLAVHDSQVRIKMSDGSAVVLESLTADVTAKPNGVVHAVGSFVFRGEKVSFDTTVGTNLDQQGAARPITAQITSPLLSASLDGSFMIGDSPRLLSPQAELSIPNVRDAARWLGAGWRPGAGFENFRAKGQLEWVNRTFAFQKASVQMDGNEANGTLSANFSGTRPSLDGTLGLKTLDLSKYFGASVDPNSASDTSLLSLVSTARGLEFPLIQSVDADLRISSDQVLVPGVTIGRSAATISLKGGKMSADIAEIEIDDGTHGGGQVRIDASGAVPSYEIRAKLEALDLGRAARAIFGHPTVQGRGDVTIEIAATGDSGESLLGSLGGKLCVTLNEGGSIGLDVNQLVAAMATPQPMSVWPAASSGAVAIDTLDARFAVANGILRTENVEAMSGDRAMKAEGAINLPTRRLDIELAIGDRAREDAGSDVKPGKREVIDMRGPWIDPDVRSGAGRAGEPPTFGPPNPG
jgi:AsmA protein